MWLTLFRLPAFCFRFISDETRSANVCERRRLRGQTRQEVVKNICREMQTHWLTSDFLGGGLANDSKPPRARQPRIPSQLDSSAAESRFQGSFWQKLDRVGKVSHSRLKINTSWINKAPLREHTSLETEVTQFSPSHVCVRKKGVTREAFRDSFSFSAIICTTNSRCFNHRIDLSRGEVKNNVFSFHYGRLGCSSTCSASFHISGAFLH